MIRYWSEANEYVLSDRNSNGRIMQQNLTILFADIANSTALYQEQGDIGAHRLIAECLLLVRKIVEKQGGLLLRTVGDAVLASFEETDSACEAAMNIHRYHQQSPLSLRVGFHHGDVIPDGGDVYGNAVNLAARVASFANAEEIYTTQITVERMSIANSSRASYLDLVDFKGVSEPMPVCRINWTEDSSNTMIFPVSNRTALFTSNSALVLSSGGREIVMNSTSAAISIGRALDNDLVVDHGSTSRVHASIQHLKGQYILVDCSTNGTYVAKHGSPPFFIRRERTSLEQQGVIGAGWDPREDTSMGIFYRISVPANDTIR